ncbi:MAG: helix-turn-helix transcriptional regulator [Bacteroidales bacterium]
MTKTLKNLRYWRRKRAWTQSYLAAKSGVTISTISRIEKGLQEPRPPTMEAIAKALGVDPSAIDW